jgi:hypothetical protein
MVLGHRRVVERLHGDGEGSGRERTTEFHLASESM